MSRRSDLIDRTLEHWASWRITLELYEGTGPSAIVRFREPAGTVANGSRPLFQGHTSRRLAALNSDLCTHLGPIQINCLLALYGLPGEDSFKARRFGISLTNLGTLRKQARSIARPHLTEHIYRTGEDYDQLRAATAG